MPILFYTASDFNNEVKALTFPAGGGSYAMSVSIEIYDDNIQEDEEAFLLYMESAQQVEITRNVSLARIRADSDCKFNFCHMSSYM